MSYSTKLRDDRLYDIVERDTKSTLQLHRNQAEIRGICRKLNLGSGFNGYTPDFFLPSFITD